MSIKSIIIKSLKRFPLTDPSDELLFTQGVNILSGEPNTGKTKWLNMLDYLMGDSDKPEGAFPNELVEKYDSINAIIQIGDEEISLARYWKEKGTKTKVFVNDQPISTEDFSSFILNKLEIPELHYPKGNPYSERAWPVLSWRSLFRHIYRREVFWSDLADKQYEGEQHACLMEFLGIAEKLFPQQLGELVDKRKKSFLLQAKKEQFMDTLEQVSKEITSLDEMSVSPTNESINIAIEKIQTRIDNLQARRQISLERLTQDATANDEDPANKIKDEVGELSEQWVAFQSERDSISVERIRIANRIVELKQYEKSLQDELERFERAKSAGEVLADIRITHCPACDRAIEASSANEDTCILCHRPNEVSGNAVTASSQRIEFEFEQLTEEAKEIKQLIAQLSTDQTSQEQRLKFINYQIANIENVLRPVRAAASIILPPEIGVIDQECGRLYEQISQLQRIKEALKIRDEISKQIDEFEKEMSGLDKEVAELHQDVNYSQSADKLEAGINTYLGALNSEQTKRWKEPNGVRVKLSDRKFSLTIGGVDWDTKLGGTLQAYFLLAYHYALLSLTDDPQCHYPGIVILDFPPKFADGANVAGQEDYIIQPFVDLLGRINKITPAQFIAAGRGFQALEGANNIELLKVWVS